MNRARSPRRALAALAAAVALIAGGLLTAPAAYAAPPLPTKMAAIGDSLSQAAMTCSSLLSCPANSWSTGTTTSVGSHYLKLRAASPTLVAYNDAVSGAKSTALPGQAAKAVTQGAQYVTVQIGANDACTSTVAGMTPTATFQANVGAALASLAASPAAPEIFVASIPNIKRMYEINRSSVSARIAWAILGTCKSMLSKPTSNAAVDVQRRDAVQQRVNEFNAALQAACAATAKCRWDGGAVANYAFTKSDISTRDYFHPSTTGQATLARVTWPTTQWVS